jgi:hypothetical protein
MAWRYGALRAQNAHWPLRGHRPIGIMGSSLLSKSVLGHYIYCWMNTWLLAVGIVFKVSNLMFCVSTSSGVEPPIN